MRIIPHLEAWQRRRVSESAQSGGLMSVGGCAVKLGLMETCSGRRAESLPYVPGRARGQL